MREDVTRLTFPLLRNLRRRTNEKKTKGRFRETLPSTDGRDDKDEDEEDGDEGSSKQREFCVISDLKLERTCQGSHERRVDHIAWWNVCVWYILLVWGMAAFQ